MPDPSDNIDWRALATRWDATYTAGPDYNPHYLEIPVGAEVLVHVDVPLVGDGVETIAFTGSTARRHFRVRAPFVSSDDFELFTRRRNWLSKFLPNVRTGDEAFDARLRVTSFRHPSALPSPPASQPTNVMATSSAPGRHHTFVTMPPGPQL